MKMSSSGGRGRWIVIAGGAVAKEYGVFYARETTGPNPGDYAVTLAAALAPDETAAASRGQLSWTPVPPAPKRVRADGISQQTERSPR